MKPIRIAGSLLLGTALLAGCSESSTPTAPSPRPLTATAALVDRSYTWSVKCNGDGGISASWSWTENGTPLASGSAGCFGGGQVSGAGVRPATANGFTALVGENAKSWTFDPAGPFKASLSGSVGGGLGKQHCMLLCINKENGQLSVDS
jgi:hypothetical protein